MDPYSFGSDTSASVVHFLAFPSLAPMYPSLPPLSKPFLARRLRVRLRYLYSTPYPSLINNITRTIPTIPRSLFSLLRPLDHFYITLSHTFLVVFPNLWRHVTNIWLLRLGVANFSTPL
jgi:hypothetical protein